MSHKTLPHLMYLTATVILLCLLVLSCVEKSPISLSAYPGPIAFWDFEDISNATIPDKSGNNHNATCTGTGFTSVTGVKGKALSLTGRAFEIVVANSKEKFISSIYSIETWFYANIDPTIHTGDDYSMQILDFSSIASNVRNGFGTHVGTSGSAAIGHAASNGLSWYSTQSTTKIGPGKWYHLVFVADGTYLKVYVNGKLDNSKAYSGNYPTPGVEARIGCQALKTGVVRGFIDGKLDELQYYDYALPAEVILDHYNN